LLPRMSFQFMQPVLVMLALLIVSYLIYRFV